MADPPLIRNTRFSTPYPTSRPTAPSLPADPVATYGPPSTRGMTSVPSRERPPTYGRGWWPAGEEDPFSISNVWQGLPPWHGYTPPPPPRPGSERLAEAQPSGGFLGNLFSSTALMQSANAAAASEHQRVAAGTIWDSYYQYLKEPAEALLTLGLAEYESWKKYSGTRYGTEGAVSDYVDMQKSLPLWQKGFVAPSLPVSDITHVAGRDNLLKFQQITRENLKEGMPWHPWNQTEPAAWVDAYRKTEFPNQYKGLVDVVADPLAIALEAGIPGGLLYRPLRMAGKHGFKQIASASSKSLHGIESGAARFGIDAIRNNAIGNLQRSDIEWWSKSVVPGGQGRWQISGQITNDNVANVDRLKRAGLARTYGDNYQMEILPSDKVEEVISIWKDRWSPGLDDVYRSVEWQTNASPDLLGGANRTIGELFPEGSPFKNIESDINAGARRVRNQRIDFQGDPVTLVRNQVVEEVDAIPNTVIRQSVSDGRPAIIGQGVTTWELPNVILSMERAMSQGKRLFLSDEQIGTLRDFLGRYGVDPWNSSDDILGRFEASPVLGDRHFIVGAFDNPFRPATGGGGVHGSRPFERHYITYNPETKAFSVQTVMGEKPKLIETGSGRVISDEIDKVIKNGDDNVLRIEAEMATTPIGSPRYKQLTGQLKAVNERKRHRLSQLEKTETVLYPPPPVAPVATVDEILEFESIWNKLHTDVVDGKHVPRGVHRSNQPVHNTDSPFAKQPSAGESWSDWNYEGHWRPAHPDEQIMDSVFMQEMNNRTHRTVWDAYHETINKIARRKNLPEPSVPHGKASEPDVVPNDSVGWLDRFLNRPGKEGNDSLAGWFGARRKAATELQSWLDDGNKLLRQILKPAPNIVSRRWYRGRYVMNRLEGEGVLKALHNEGPIPEGMEELVEHIKSLRDRETSDYIAFNPGLEDIFASHPDYFPRLWVPPVDKSGKRYVYDPGRGMVTVPNHLRPRNDISFSEMIDLGWEPVSWNPLDLMAIRRLDGINHRETMLLIERLKKSRVAMTREELIASLPSDIEDPNKFINDNFKVPDIGPAFEGMAQYSAKDKKTKYLPKYLVPNNIAGKLENIWGTPATFRVDISGKGVDLGPILRNFATGLKRSILLGSGFQHVDMYFRSGASGLSLTGMRQLWGPKIPGVGKILPFGGPVKMLPLTGRILAASFYQGKFLGLGRRAIRERTTSSKPLYDDFDISLGLVADEGWNTTGDPSIIRREAVAALDDIRRTTNPNAAQFVFDRMRNTIRWWESGLFDGVYRETQAFMLENFIIPKLRKSFPNESPRMIARRAADEVNVLTSSLGEWQTVLSSPHVKELTRMALFSSNETEAWLKASYGAVKGETKQLYQEYWIGYMTFLAAMANAINYKVTGELMPLASYNPIHIRETDSTSTMPYHVGYNTRFMAPIIGNGRNGQPIHLDIVGQADTPFRWLLDLTSGTPGSALSSRVSPLLGLARPFITKETFFGEPLESGMDQLTYAFMQYMPMGAWQTLQGLRTDHELAAKYIPSNETGIGWGGRRWQIAGFNVRRKSARELLDELARRAGFDEPPREWDNWEQWVTAFNRPTPYEVMLRDSTPGDIKNAWQHPDNADIVNELKTRTEEGVRRGQEGAERRNALLVADETRLDEEADIYRRLSAGELKLYGPIDPTLTWYYQYQEAQKRYITKVKEIQNIYSPEKEKPKEELPQARFEYFEALENSLSGGMIDWDEFDVEIKRLRRDVWTPAQNKHIDDLEQKDRFANHTLEGVENPEWIAEQLTRRDKYSWYFEIDSEYWKNIGMTKEWKEWKLSNDQPAYERANPKFAANLEQVRDMKKRVRENDINLLEMLVIFGNVSPTKLHEIISEQEKINQ